MSYSILRRLVLALTLALFTLLALAADAFDQYLQSIQTLEQAQAQQRNIAIHYSDPNSGDLLHAVLDPARALPMVDFYGELQKQGIRRGDLPNLLQPTLSLYERAFADDPKHYETEYLDALKLTVTLRLQARRALERTRADILEHQREHPEQSGASTGSFFTLMRLAAGADQALAAGIRRDVQRKRYSVEGGRRALQLAAVLEAN